MIYSTTSTYRLSNQTAYSFKALDNEAATIYTITLDRDGEEVDPDLLLAVERAAYRALYGKLEPELSEWVQRASGYDRKSVMVWVKEPIGLPRITPPMPHSDVSQEAVDRYFAQVRSLREAQVSSVVCPVADRCREHGLSVRYGRYVPVLYGDLTPSEVRLLESWEEVDSIGLVREAVPFMDTARQTVRADVVEGRNITGSGVEVVLVEVRESPGRTRIALTNPYLDGVQEANTNCTQISAHATQVAGIIRSTHSTVRGVSPDVSLWSGVACDGNNLEEVMQLSEDAIEWGARAINLSWGKNPAWGALCEETFTSLETVSRFYDTLVINNRVSVIAAAGNHGVNFYIDEKDQYIIQCGALQFAPIPEPAVAYNIIAVGGFDDKDTAEWTDDCLYVSSSWCDPFSTNDDREKTEVVAPAASIKSTLTNSPWVGCGSLFDCDDDYCGCRFNSSDACLSSYWGTSFAAPSVTGIAALMIQRSRNLESALEAWPEAIKAILMATAIHNIEGDTRLSECDGAGGVVADFADDVVRGVEGNWGAMEYHCSSSNQLDVATMNLVTGQRVRVVIVWAVNPHPVSERYPDQPNADLDLLIVNTAGNNVVAQSVSCDNPYEIVDFHASGSGTYKIRVVRNYCEMAYPPSYLAWAWWTEPPQ